MWEQLVDRQKGIVNFTDELTGAIGRTRVLAAGAGETAPCWTAWCARASSAS